MRPGIEAATIFAKASGGKAAFDRLQEETAIIAGTNGTAATVVG